MMGRRGPFVGRERMDVLRGGRGQDYTWGEEDRTGTVHGMQNDVSEPFMGEKIEKKDRKFIGGGGECWGGPRMYTCHLPRSNNRTFTMFCSLMYFHN